MSALERRDVDSGTERCRLGNVYISDGGTKICWPGPDSISARGRRDVDSGTEIYRIGDEVLPLYVVFFCFEIERGCDEILIDCDEW